MGFGAAIGGGIILSVVVVVAGLSISTLLRTNESMVQATNQRNIADGKFAATALQISSIEAVTPPTPDNIVRLTLQNTGSEKLWNFGSFDILLQYSYINVQGNGTVMQSRTESLTYAGNVPENAIATGKWGLTSFVNDRIDPGILNPGESIEISCVLRNDIVQNSNLFVSVVADNGAQITRSVEVA